MSAADIWKTAKEWAARKLPGVPSSLRGFQLRAERDGWASRPREKSGGGHEYPLSALPEKAQEAYRAREQIREHARIRAVVAERVGPRLAEMVDLDCGEDGRLASGDKAIARRDAALEIYRAYEEFRAETCLPTGDALKGFVLFFLSAKADWFAGRPVAAPKAISSLPEWVFQGRSKMSVRTLERIIATVKAGEFQALRGRFQSRKDTGVLDLAIDPRGKIEGTGAVRKALLAIIADRPHLSARAMRDQIIGNFGAELVMPSGEVVEMPPLRTFQWHIKKLKAENESLILSVQNPDAWRSKYQFAFGEQFTGEHPNDIWQIDASPADVLLKDGRHSVYVLIDLYTRRTMILVTRTPRAAAVIALVRRAILAWGVPNTIKTDNGSDFKARIVRGVLEALKIDAPLSPAFTPTDKGHVERVIGTLQHDLMPRLPGFIGHNVADRSAIEARRSFAERIGDRDEAKAFCVSMDQVELQRQVDMWAETEYQHRPHEGLDGRTPAEVEAGWTGVVRRVASERALDLLLWDLPSGDGIRTVTKKGFPADGGTFWGPGLEPGRRVRVRLDPTDMGRAYVYAVEDDAFLCVAECPERSGVSRAEVAARAKAEQRAAAAAAKKDLHRAKRTLRPYHEIAEEVARSRVPVAPDNVTTLPRASVPYHTPALAGAADAAGAELPAVPQKAAAVVTPAAIIRLPERPETPEDRERRAKREAMERWRRIDAALTAGEDASDADRRFHRDYQTLPEFRAAMRVEKLRASGLFSA